MRNLLRKAVCYIYLSFSKASLRQLLKIIPRHQMNKDEEERISKTSISSLDGKWDL